MTSRFFRRLLCQLLLLCACAQVLAADVDVQARIEASEEGYKLDATYRFELNRGLEDALQRGVKLFFTTEIDMTRRRWYWTDERPVSASRTYELSFNTLTRRYRVTNKTTHFQQTYDTVDEALATIRLPGRWLLVPRGALKVGETYSVSLRMYLDRSELQKPLQVNALNDADWQLSSSKKTFQYRAE
ncbi:MAG: DUF4390 domain-containing protein [Massilia sp.]